MDRLLIRHIDGAAEARRVFRKLVFPHEVQPAQVVGLNFEHFYLQPMDGPERLANTQAAVAYCQAQPRWRLSLQTHKLIGIP